VENLLRAGQTDPDTSPEKVRCANGIGAHPFVFRRQPHAERIQAPTGYGELPLESLQELTPHRLPEEEELLKALGSKL
jgi:hypothetical protein